MILARVDEFLQSSIIVLSRWTPVESEADEPDLPDAKKERLAERGDPLDALGVIGVVLEGGALRQFVNSAKDYFNRKGASIDILPFAVGIVVRRRSIYEGSLQRPQGHRRHLPYSQTSPLPSPSSRIEGARLPAF